MKQLLFVFLVIPTAYGMDILQDRLNCFATKFYYDLPAENIPWNINDVIFGKTIIDLVYLAGRVDLDLVEFMRHRGAKAANELAMPNEKRRPLIRAISLVNHIAPRYTS